MSSGKILLLTPDFPPQEGGVARYLSAVAEHYAKRIDVIASHHKDAQGFDSKVDYLIYRKKLLFTYLWPKWLKSVILLWNNRHRYDAVLVSHVLPFGSASWLAKFFTKVPYIVFVHGMDIRLATQSKRKMLLARRVLQGSQLIVANSEALSKELQQMFGVKDVLVVYPCVQEIHEDTNKQSNDALRLLTVSRLVERKGHVHVLNALAHLRRTGQLTSFRYSIVGDGPMMSTLRSVVESLDLGDYVIFHGSVTDAQRCDLYRQSDVFIMPVSQDPVDKEGFGLVYIEAASYEVPSISTRVPGVDEAVIDGVTGILLENQNEQGVAKAIQYLAQHPEVRMSLGKQAKQHANQFLCDQQIAQLDAYL